METADLTGLEPLALRLHIVLRLVSRLTSLPDSP